MHHLILLHRTAKQQWSAIAALWPKPIWAAESASTQRWHRANPTILYTFRRAPESCGERLLRAFGAFEVGFFEGFSGLLAFDLFFRCCWAFFCLRSDNVYNDLLSKNATAKDVRNEGKDIAHFGFVSGSWG